MRLAEPDIIVTNPDGEYLILVEVKLNDNIAHNGIDQLKRSMAFMNCSMGILVSGERIYLLHDSLQEFDGASINIVGEARLPHTLLPPPDHQWKDEPALEFESQIQGWLEGLKFSSNVQKLPNDLRKLFSESMLSLLRWGEVRSAGPRWSKTAS
jgi:hypothetical protein